MARPSKDSKLVRCGKCGHSTNMPNGVEPPKGTPLEKICVTIGNRPVSWQCECGYYNRYCQSSKERELYIERLGKTKTWGQTSGQA